MLSRPCLEQTPFGDCREGMPPAFYLEALLLTFDENTKTLG